MQIALRKWREDDIPLVAQYANNPKVAANLRDTFPSPYTLRDAVDFVHMCMEDDETARCHRCVTADGEPAGSIGVFLRSGMERKTAEIGYWFGEPFWGRGVASEAIRQMCALAFQQYDLVRIFGVPYGHNKASQRALEKAGFTLEGRLRKDVIKNGEYLDSMMYALVR